MDEQQYKSTYNLINPQRCIFEKAINSRVCDCNKSQRFNLADREGIACTHGVGLKRCSNFLAQLRKNARFALKCLDMGQPLAHAAEIKIQNGGLLSLQNQVKDKQYKTVEDIDGLITIAESKYKDLENFPYSQFMQAIAAYRIRNRDKRSKPKNRIN